MGSGRSRLVRRGRRRGIGAGRVLGRRRILSDGRTTICGGRVVSSGCCAGRCAIALDRLARVGPDRRTALDSRLGVVLGHLVRRGREDGRGELLVHVQVAIEEDAEQGELDGLAGVGEKELADRTEGDLSRVAYRVLAGRQPGSTSFVDALRICPC